MTLSVQCPGCDWVCKAPQEFLGRRVRCKKCNCSFVLQIVTQAVKAPNSAPFAMANPRESLRDVLREVASRVPPPPPTPEVLPLPPDERRIPATAGDSPGAKLSAANSVPRAVSPTPEVLPLPPDEGPLPLPEPVPAPANLAPGDSPGAKWLPGRRVRHIAALTATVLFALGAITYVASFFFSSEPTLGRFGGIEIGSSGIKMIVLDFFGSRGTFDYHIVIRDDQQVNLATLPAGSNSFDPVKLDKMVSAVKQYMKMMQSDYAVPPENIHIAASSALLKNIKDVAGAVNENRKAVRDRVKEAVQREVEFLSSDDDPKLSFEACVLGEERNRALLIDVGSNETRGGYGRLIFSSFELKRGTKNYKGLVDDMCGKSSGRRFRDVAAELRGKELQTPLKEAISRDGGFLTRDKIYLIGGACYAMATYTHAADRDLRVSVTSADIAEFGRIVAEKNPEEARKEILGKITDPKVQKEAADDFDQVEKVFTQRKSHDILIAAAEILHALDQEFAFGKKELVFFRDGHFAPLLGYLTEKSGVARQ